MLYEIRLSLLSDEITLLLSHGTYLKKQPLASIQGWIGDITLIYEQNGL